MSEKQQDPTFEVVVERLHRMAKDLENDRIERKAEFGELKRDFSDRLELVQMEQKKIGSILNRARGGYMVLLGLGGLVAWFAGLFERFAK